MQQKKLMELFGAELAHGVGTPGLAESLTYFTKRHPDLAMKLVEMPSLQEAQEYEMPSLEEAQDFEMPSLEEAHNTQISESGDQNHRKPHMKNVGLVVEGNRRIAEASREILKEGKVPFFIGGDHSSAIGTVAASAEAFPGEGLIWIDAHADIHLPETSVSGNIHGMPVAVALGRGDERLTAIANGHFIDPKHLVFLGLRDVEPAEQEHIEAWGIKYYTYEEMQRRGLEAVLAETCAYLQGVNGVHISVDMDGMDPELMPAVSVPVEAGFSPEEEWLMLDFLASRLRVNALDIVEFNYLLDKNQVSERWLYDIIVKILAIDADKECCEVE